MLRLLVIVGLLLAGGLTACSTPPPPPPPAPTPNVRVILLPQQDANGQPLKTAVSVQEEDKNIVLDQPFAVAERTATGGYEQRTATAEEVRARYGDILRIQPPTPEVFVLRFLPGKSQLTSESESQLPALVEKAKARAGGEILVIGHTDTVGKAEANDDLSLRRARAVANLLVSKGFSADLITPIGRGERELAVPTADEVAEPRNRRVEILIR
jgi:outer membrane protein OmpA-like peptidoglycan-associated protein